MEFIIKWIISYGLVMFAMCTDNIFWISSSPEYEKFKKWKIKEKLKYIITYRIKTVLTDWRDICPGIMTSLILSLVWYYF